MPKRIPVETVVVVRDGKRVSPPIGQPFNFTTEEIEQIVGTASKSGVRPQALKKLTVEDDSGDDEVEITAGRSGPKADESTEVEDAAAVSKAAKDRKAVGATKGKDTAGDGAEDL